jgi:hypothetical protein
MAAMSAAGVLAQILPEAAAGPQFEAAVAQGDDAVIRLMTLLPSDERVVREAATRLRLPNSTRDRLTAAAAADPSVSLLMSDPEVRAAAYRFGVRAVADALNRRWAENPAGDDDAARQQVEPVLDASRQLPVLDVEVLRISHDRMTDMGRMRAQLVRAASLRLQFQQGAGQGGVLLHTTPQGDAGLAASVNDVHRPVRPIQQNRQIDGLPVFRHRQHALDPGEVLFVHLPGLKRHA